MGLKGLGLGLRDLDPRWCFARDDASRAGFARVRLDSSWLGIQIFQFQFSVLT